MKIIKIIDLTHTFTASMPAYPDDPSPSLQQIASFRREGYEDYLLTSGLHVGTHLDAPAHMITGGKRIDELLLERFRGKGVAIDARGKKEIDGGSLENLDIEKKEVVLFCTGWSSRFRMSGYFTNFPVMTEALAHELVRRKVKMIGLDTPSPDNAPFQVHKILLGADILIIENLNNVEALLGKKEFEVQAFPIKFSADAAFARVVAVF